MPYGPPRSRVPRHPVAVGDLYKAHGSGPRGFKAGTVYWLVATVNERVVHLLGLNRHGEIVSTTSYGVHALEERARIANIKTVAKFAAELKKAGSMVHEINPRKYWRPNP